jgi:hypothetical protein
VRQHPRPAAPQLGGQFLPGVAEDTGRRLQQPLTTGVPRDADPLEGGDLLDDRPALVDGAEHVGLGDPQVVEEHFVEVMRPHHAPNGAHLDGRIIHRHKENRQTLLFLLAAGGAGQQEAPLRHGGVRGPDLLPADQPAVAVRLGGGA